MRVGLLVVSLAFGTAGLFCSYWCGLLLFFDWFRLYLSSSLFMLVWLAPVLIGLACSGMVLSGVQQWAIKVLG